MIPLSKPYVSQEIFDRILEVLESGQFILGKQCREFEKEFAKFTGVKHAVLTSSGTSAIFLCLKAMGIGKGDGILVPSLTAFPTIEPIFHVGARPIFIDVDDTFTMSQKYLEIVLHNRKTWPVKIKGILPVHLYGHPADMDSILELASLNKVFVLEDCCQAHGARYKGKMAGSMGIAGCFSFYPSKNMTVLGDGGILVTNDDEIARLTRMLRDHGRRDKYDHEIVGYNLRFNEIQGAIGRSQLKLLESFNESRRKIAEWYDEGLRDVPVILPPKKEWVEPVYHLYVIMAEHRDKLALFLKDKGIQTGIHYPIPCHMQQGVREAIGVQLRLMRTEEVANKILSLPMYPELEKEKVDYICKCIREFY